MHQGSKREGKSSTRVASKAPPLTANGQVQPVSRGFRAKLTLALNAERMIGEHSRSAPALYRAKHYRQRYTAIS